MNYLQKRVFLSLLLMILVHLCYAKSNIEIKGRILIGEGKPAEFATVYIKSTNYHTYTDAEGNYSLRVPEKDYILGVMLVGYKAYERPIQVNKEVLALETIYLKPLNISLKEVTVEAESNSELVNKLSYNVKSIELADLQNSTSDLSQALGRIEGIKIRESGGVGSQTNISLNGFSGSHVKIFIDGVPQEGVGNAFSISNIPANYAERIEVYDGVVPIEFGTDAIGGVINIVTNKRAQKFALDASYSYGSFNTHKSFVRLNQTFKNGLMYKLQAFQNYSDNNYWVDTYVTQFLDGGLEFTDPSDIQRVQRFNDTYHNESFIGTIGLANKSWADIITLEMNYSQFYKESQTGVTQPAVFGEKYRYGNTHIYSFNYSKRNLITKGLDLKANASFNNDTQNTVDTTSLRYNWLGETTDRLSGSPKTLSDTKTNTSSANITASYNILKKHYFALNQSMTSTSRVSRSMIANGNTFTDYDTPMTTTKNISGVSYRFKMKKSLDINIFGKYYNQFSEGSISDSDDGYGSYIPATNRNESFGYGAATSYFIFDVLQAKLSYEHSYRLPTTNELFGDADLEVGELQLLPEKSDNFNFNLTYRERINKHFFTVKGSLIYRDTKDWIQRGIGTDGTLDFGYYENFGRVITKGYTLLVRYEFGRLLSIGGTLNNLNARDDQEYLADGSLRYNPTYEQRMPNEPYLYANGDGALNFFDILQENDKLSLGYDLLYMHSFPLQWEEFGSADTKMMIPTQLSHNLIVSYAMKQGKYNFSFECQNLSDADLYDNYSLQKAGRAFCGKVRISIGKYGDNNKTRNNNK